jgi:PKD repeat protein
MLAAAVMLPGAEAQKVLNPGDFTLTPLGGSLAIRNTVFDLAPRALAECSDGIDNGGYPAIDYPNEPNCTSPNDDSELVPGFQPKVDVTLSGSIDGAGNVTIPPSGVVFPTYYVPVQDPFNGLIYPVAATVVPTTSATGTLNPINGAAALRVRFYIRLEGQPLGVGLGSTCTIGTAASPIDINVLTTGVTSPPAPALPISGVPYSASTGQLRVVNNSFSVPGASGCPIGLFNLNDIINQQLLLPSPAGANSAVIDGRTTPVLGRGVQARITTTPALVNGPAPFTVTFDASTSTVAKPPATYRWDFPDGTFQTGVNVTKTFDTAGTQQVRLTVTDADGDQSIALKNVVVTAGSTTSSTSSTTSSTSSTTSSTSSTTSSTSSTTSSTSSTTSSTSSTTSSTSSTTSSTSSTTSSTSSTTSSTTTTTLEPGGGDALSVQVSGSFNYTNGGAATAGNVRVLRDPSGIQSALGTLDLPGRNGGTARLSVQAQRFWIFQLWTGTVSLFDPAAGVSLSAPVFGTLSNAPGTNAVTSTSSWFSFGQFPNLIRPYTLRWSVDDVS